VCCSCSNEIPVRLQAVLESKYPHIESAPFAWTDNYPRLLDRNAVTKLVALATEAAARMQKEFGLPLALVVIDTVVAAAGYSKVGEESDAAIGQAIMNVMEEVAQRSGVLVLGIDHFGKSAETGTRGTSAKEGAADVVLALLGAKQSAAKSPTPAWPRASAGAARAARNFHSRCNQLILASINMAARSRRW
jgi:hypothetical protein